MRRKGNKAGEINKGKVKNEENGEKEGRRMEGGKKISPQRTLRKKGLVSGEGEQEGEAGGVNEDKCTVWCLCKSVCVCVCV